ncbi:MAG TPA: Mur ligase domain-containing protein [Thermoanaerobaculaceae bacterium]|nr:Mur ligase domain-containing protein [Acidobacteriota bacterium]HPW54109.1 Mur ligase domain-containing protein [Thermoanaerobaculaceae bacterium]
MQKPCQLYFLPIGGTAMAPLAGLMHESGLAVCGVDSILYPPMSELLAELGIPVRLGFDPAAIPEGIDQVVIGNALPRSNPEVQAVLARGLPFTSQAAALGERFCRPARTVVVAGTHGKTTTTALCAHIFTGCGLDPTVLIGGVPCGGRPWRLGRGGWTVVEGDEYNTAFFDKEPKFLHYYPHFFVVGNVEFDHGDIFPNLDAIVAAFHAGTALVGEHGAVVANFGDAGARTVAADHPRVVWYGHERGADLRCLGWGHADGRLVASLAWRGTTFSIAAPLVGLHNLDNVMAACTCALLAGLDPQAVDAALRSFGGVRRRLEVVGEIGGVTVVDDFAHHPTAVRLTLEGARCRFGNRRIVAVFEPRSLTAGRPVFAQAYEEALLAADLALVAPVFHRHRLGAADVLDRDAVVRNVRRRGGQAVAIPEETDILTTVRACLRPNDVVICMSSGDFGGLPRHLLELLRDER